MSSCTDAAASGPSPQHPLTTNYLANLRARGGAGIVLATGTSSLHRGVNELAAAIDAPRFVETAEHVEQASFDGDAFLTTSATLVNANVSSSRGLVISKYIRTPFSFLWIPNSAKGTILKISTTAPYQVVGEYMSAPYVVHMM